MYRKRLNIILTMAFLAVISTGLGEEADTPEALIHEALNEIIKGGLKHGDDEASILAATTNALGWMATGGSPHYLEPIGKFANSRAKACKGLDVMTVRTMQTTEAGLTNLFLCEYYLITRDPGVVSGIEALSTYLAFAQSGIGTWGTEIPDVKAKGLYGRAKGTAANENFGTDNNCTLIVATSLVLARKCGVTTKPVEDAIERTRAYLRYYVEKGGIPINLPRPHRYHNGGNRSAHAAIFFHLVGDKVAAKYFTRLAFADKGHGPRFDAKWSKAGNQLLKHCYSRHALYITGKAGSALDYMTKEEVQESIKAGTFDAKKASDEELLAALSSWSMAVRYAAGKQIEKRKLQIDDKLLAMLKSDDRYARYGACAAFRNRKKPAAVIPIIAEILQKDTDEAMLHFAAHVIGIRYGRDRETDEFRSAAKKAVPEFTKVIYRGYPGKDPQNRIAVQLAETMVVMLHRAEFSPYFKNGEGMKDAVPTENLIPVLRTWLNNPYASTRVAALQVCQHMDEKALEPLYEDIYFACTTEPPGRGVKSKSLKMDGYTVLGNLRFAEGLDHCLDYVKEEGRFGLAMVALASYGLNNLKPHWDRIEPILTPYMDRKEHKGHHQHWHEIWKKVLAQSDKDKVELRSIKPYLTEARIKANRRLFPKDFR